MACNLTTQPHLAQVDYSAKDPMRFTLIDRIVELEPGVQITAVKNLTMAEEYLADHFPHFPVMPGVLMLEAMTQAAAWLARAREVTCLELAAQVKAAKRAVARDVRAYPPWLMAGITLSSGPHTPWAIKR